MADGKKQKRSNIDDEPEYLVTTDQGTPKLNDTYYRMRDGGYWANQGELGAALAQVVGRGTYSGKTVSALINGTRRFEFHVAVAFYELLGYDWDEVARPVDPNEKPTISGSIDDEPDVIPQDLPVLYNAPVGREKELAGIHLALQEKGRVVLSGMPGVGKSLLALHYAHKYTNNYAGGVFWVNVTTETARDSAEALSLQLIELAISEAVEPPKNMDAAKQLSYCARHWPRAPHPVLLVLDNVETVKALRDCLEWLPTERFKLLITTRPQLRVRQAQRIELLPLQAEAALAIFQRVLDDDDLRLEEHAALAELCTTVLGGLPLALQIVATSLAEEEFLTVNELNRQLRASSNPLQEAILDDIDMLESVKHNVTAAFERSWRSLSAETQMLAQIVSLFTPSPIPLSLVQTVAQTVPNITSLYAACGKLQKLSLLDRIDAEVCQMHRLLRSFFQAKARLSPYWADWKKDKEVALFAMCRAVPERCTAKEAAPFAIMEPHIKAMIHDGVASLEGHRALQRFYLGQGLYRQALNWSEQAIALSKTLDLTTEEKVSCYQYAGEAVLLVGMPQEALQQLDIAHDLLKDEPASAQRAQVLTLLAAAQYQFGQLDKAEATIQQVLELCQLYFPAESLEMADAMLTEATIRYLRLRQAQAAPSDQAFRTLEARVQEVLLIREKLRPDNVEPLAEAMNLQAKIYESMGQQAEALKIYHRAAIITRPPHPDAANARNNLAKALEDQSGEQRVIKLYQDAIEIFHDAEVFDREGWSRHNLGLYHASKGRLVMGLEMVEAACDLLERLDSPLKDACKNHLAELKQRRQAS